MSKIVILSICKKSLLPKASSWYEFEFTGEYQNKIINKINVKTSDSFLIDEKYLLHLIVDEVSGDCLKAELVWSNKLKK